jgi:NADPH-dependent curcumin reductase CurA
VAARLNELCRGAIDIYFDNVGGTTLDAALGELAIGSRVVLCGGTSQYTTDSDWHGPKNYFQLVYRQASMAGFYIFTYQSRFHEAYQVIGDAIRRGALTYAEDIAEGIEQAPEGLRRVLASENFGTMLVRVKAD